MKNSIFARFARAFFIFGYFEDVLALSTTWKDLICSFVDDVSIWWQLFNIVFLSPKRWFQLDSRIVRTHFSSIMTSNNRVIITETRSYIFRWRSRCCRRCVCLSSLLILPTDLPSTIFLYIYHYHLYKWYVKILFYHLIQNTHESTISEVIN